MRHARRTGIGGGSAVGTALAGGTTSQAGRHRKVPGPMGRGVVYRDVMSSDLVVVPSWLGVSALAGRVSWARHAVYPVVDATGAPMGVLDLAALDQAAVGPGTALDSLAVAAPVVRADDIMPLPVHGESRPARTFALVVEGDRLIGLVSEGSLLRYERRRALGCA